MKLSWVYVFFILSVSQAKNECWHEREAKHWLTVWQNNKTSWTYKWKVRLDCHPVHWSFLADIGGNIPETNLKL